MKINQPTDNSLYVTIGNFTYYFDDSIDGECCVNRWHKDDDDINKPVALELCNLIDKISSKLSNEEKEKLVSLADYVLLKELYS